MCFLVTLTKGRVVGSVRPPSVSLYPPRPTIKRPRAPTNERLTFVELLAQLMLRCDLERLAAGTVPVDQNIGLVFLIQAEQ